MGIGFWWAIVGVVAAVWFGWARLRPTPARWVLNLSTVVLVAVTTGALETVRQHVGAGWNVLPVMLFSSAVAICFLWVQKPTPAQDTQTETASFAYDPITYVDLASVAVALLGWNFDARWQDVDFRDCIKAGCHAGVIAMEAIQIDAYTDKNRRTRHLPSPILRTDWQLKKFSIWREDDVSFPLNKSDNWDIYVGKMMGKRVGNYLDPRLTSRADAINWVRIHGDRFRGQNEIGATKDAERRRRLEVDLAREEGEKT